ncbi:hypothetical protein F4781DRAFT_325988 [Annulohypoxylon bovei var. microspora]|nr:hypothetical protein F4781DRAFT_325988 [Annulohypoxylon bovei var. microspora]
MVSQVASIPRSLESLPARPPTPPREKKQDVLSSSNQILSSQPIDTRLNLHTPPNYSPDTVDTSNVSSRRSRKKVGFLAQAEYREAPNYANKENVRKQATPTSALSSAVSIKPIKSILKQSSSPILRNSLDLSAFGDEGTGQINIVTMLDSTIKQLAGADRESKIDAYTMLARALKTSNNLPDRIALQDKMSLFMQFIQRDVTTKGPNGTIDSSMVNHSLTLLCTFFHFPAIASTISSDFGIFIIDHSIKSFDDPAVPKDVIRHLMQVVASQYFSGKVMTADRVGRLVNTLHKIEEHIKGKSIIMSRILIYRRLIKQAKSHMATHSDWLLDLFTDMLSSLKEIRASAIALGLEASFTIGKEKQLSRRVMEILQLQVEETQYIEYYIERLMNMTKDKLESASVPQVWSVVILLLRCPVDRWEFFSPWLEIIQRCFNSGDYHTRLEANYAWNRLVYSLHFNESSFSKTIATVCQPFLSQLRRKGGNKQLEELRKVVVAGVCNLYYYAFGPNLSTARIESYWDACVRPLVLRLTPLEVDGKTMEKTALISSDNLTQSILILTSLFNSSTPRLWKEDRVAESTLVKPNELPALDPKWVRRNAPRVFVVVEPIIENTFLDLANPESPSHQLWRTLVGAVASAASKEVKVSSETATFMAHSFSTLALIWSRGLNQPDVEPDSQQRFLDATQAYVSTMTESLGLLPFTEKLLSLNQQNSFKLVATPSSRPGKGQALARTPLHHLFSMLSTIPPGIPDNDGLLNLIRVCFDPFIISRSSSHAKTDLARELMQTLPVDVPCPYGPWVFISDILSLSLESSQSSYQTTASGSQPTTIGHEYREIVKHLERGIKSTPGLPWEQWHTLFQLLVTRVTSEAGEAGCAIAVVEPLAKSLLESYSTTEDAMPHNILKTSVELVATARQPRDRQALDAARRRLWGTSIAGPRSTSFDPFDNLYRLINHTLEISYIHVSQYDQNETVVSLLTEVSNFITRCSPSLVLKSLLLIQHGISLWIQDANAQYGSKQSSMVCEAVKTLWHQVCSLLLDTDSLSSLELDTVEELLCSAFQSKHRDIVNDVSAMWNRIFEQVEEIQYPEKLKEVLISIHAYVDIVLPGLDLSIYEPTGQEPAFIESQDDSEIPKPSLDEENLRRTPPIEGPSSRQSATPGSVQLSLPSNRRPNTTPNTSRPRSTKQSTTPKLRHNDSQIQFAPIESSSPGQNVESQVLTDRQREVRERQRENAAIFPQIRSSVEKRKSPRSTTQHQKQGQDPVNFLQQTRAATPEPNRDLEDYVSSTPTPRRGQAAIVDDDHEMIDDVPSSPPEPRRNLLEEMRPLSRNSGMFQEFPLSSSPISGSPVPKRRPILVSKARVGQEDVEMDQDDNEETSHHDEQEETPKPKPIVSGGVKDDELEEIDAPGPSTPRRTRSMGKGLESSPRSDREVFVDALTSPVRQTPRTLRSNAAAKKQAAENTTSSSQPKDGSFELSDGEERSFARLVVELDSRKCSSQPGANTESPEKRRKVEKSAAECITVESESRRLRSQSKKDEDSSQSSSVAPSSSAEIETPRSSSKRSKRKRKRQTEKSQEPSSSHKKRRHRKQVEAEAEEAAGAGAELVPNSHISEDNAMHADKIAVAAEDIELDTDLSFSEVQEPTSSEPAWQDQQDQQDSSPVSFDDSLIERESDTEAVNLQIITEASQQSELEPIPAEILYDDMPVVDADTEMINQTEEVEEPVEEVAQMTTERSYHAEEPVAEKTKAEQIIDALRGGLEGLRTAMLTRDEVNKIEDMFFDIKKELYQAESRSRR